MRLNDEVYEFIKQEVIDLFVRYGVNSAPISGFELAQKMGIMIIPYSTLSRIKLYKAMIASPDGFYLELGNGREYVFYNDNNGMERSNMTILHEIGHCVLGHNDNSDSEEAEANFFAKYAIAPPPLIHRFKPNKPEVIRKYFFISYEAARNSLAYYYKWLKIWKGIYKDYEVVLLRQFAIAS